MGIVEVDRLRRNGRGGVAGDDQGRPVADEFLGQPSAICRRGHLQRRLFDCKVLRLRKSRSVSGLARTQPHWRRSSRPKAACRKPMTGRSDDCCAAGAGMPPAIALPNHAMKCLLPILIRSSGRHWLARKHRAPVRSAHCSALTITVSIGRYFGCPWAPAPSEASRDAQAIGYRTDRSCSPRCGRPSDCSASESSPRSAAPPRDHCSCPSSHARTVGRGLRGCNRHASQSSTHSDTLPCMS